MVKPAKKDEPGPVTDEKVWERNGLTADLGTDSAAVLGWAALPPSLHGPSGLLARWTRVVEIMGGMAGMDRSKTLLEERSWTEHRPSPRIQAMH